MKKIDLYKDNEIEVVMPKNFMNVGIGNMEGEFPVLFADTNDSKKWDNMRIPLPNGNWSIAKCHDDGKTITLKHEAIKRSFFSKWF